MKLYTITKVRSNVCEVDVKAYTNYQEALTYWNELYAQEKEYYEDAIENFETEEQCEEYILSPEQKHFSYDDGVKNKISTKTRTKNEQKEEQQ